MIHEVPDLPDSSTFEGREGVRKWLEFAPAQFDEVPFELVRIEGTDEVTVADVHATARGRGSGVPVAWNTFIVFRWRGELVSEAAGFLRREEALAAAGLAEPPG